MSMSNLSVRSNLFIRIEESKTLTSQEKLILGLLVNEDMTVQQIIDCLMSDTYDLTFNEILFALNRLRRKNLIRMAEFRKSDKNFSVDIYLTLVTDWFFKI